MADENNTNKRELDSHGAEGAMWDGFDLDAVLAWYDKWRGVENIGKPVPKMIERIRRLHDEGTPVKIITARVSPKNGEDEKKARAFITAWCVKNLGFVPEITHEKDSLMRWMYDDRCKQVIPNTGVLVEDELERTRKALEDIKKKCEGGSVDAAEIASMCKDALTAEEA